jgi:hypothetical protein
MKTSDLDAGSSTPTGIRRFAVVGRVVLFLKEFVKLFVLTNLVLLWLVFWRAIFGIHLSAGGALETATVALVYILPAVGGFGLYLRSYFSASVR